MKKLDKLILSSFFGPFFITFFVVVFILLTQFMLRYFDEIVGKDLGVGVISQLIFYFSINMTTNALPLAVLLSSLMTFGNLGEHFELTAIKGSGISLLRTMRPLFAVACVLVIIGFFNNNYIVPKANLEAFSLLYDIKQKKPALDIKQGVFYHGIPGYSIKINHKFDDDETLKDIIIYDHLGQRGNKEIILADSGKMYNILDNRYLVLELFKGKSFSEQSSRDRRRIGSRQEASPYLRSQFDKSKMVFSLSEFDLKRTRKDLFSNNRLMKNITQLKTDLDSMLKDYDEMYQEVELNSSQFFKYHLKDDNQLTERARLRSMKKAPVDIAPEIEVDKREADIKREYKISSDSIRIVDEKEEDADSTSERGILNIDKLKNKRLLAKRMSDSALVQRRGIEVRKSDSLVKKEVSDKSAIANKTKIMKDSLTADEDSLIAKDSLEVLDTALSAQTGPYYKIDSLLNTERVKVPAMGQALNHVRYVKGNLSTQNIQMDNMIKQIRRFEIEKFKKLSMAMTILAMFLIGAPLGAIIKRGGLGMPVLLSILFFVLFYVISMLGEKWARQGIMTPLFGVWLANIFLFPVGFFFLKQARKDARLFDTDYYRVLWERIRKKMRFS